MAELRPYQRDFCDAVLKDLGEHQRLLGVLPTGGGKTVASAEILKRYNRPSLFLADAKELVYQAADKIQAWTGIIPDVEMGDSRACGSSQIIVGTTQSLARRLEKYYPEDISLIVIDKAHRNTLGSQALRVLNYFSRAKVVGITATPYRSDKKLLSAFYEKISYEIGLFELIAQGYLSRIVVNSGFDIEVPEMCKGLASKIIDLLFQRREMGLASPKQVRLMHRLGFKNVSTISFETAKEKISARLDRKARHDN